MRMTHFGRLVKIINVVIQAKVDITYTFPLSHKDCSIPDRKPTPHFLPTNRWNQCRCYYLIRESQWRLGKNHHLLEP